MLKKLLYFKDSFKENVEMIGRLVTRLKIVKYIKYPFALMQVNINTLPTNTGKDAI
jgi:hypothetical protein